MSALPWIRKHAPRSSREIVGQENAVARVKEFLSSFRKGMKPLLLHGPTGTGKTVTVLALAEELDLEVIEMNASDARNKAAIDALLGAALQQRSLFFRGKAILVDEADGLSGMKDRGGVQALLALLDGASFPVVITANDIESEKLKALKKACAPVAFAPLGQKEIVTLLARIAQAEGIEAEERALGAIARRAGGDARAAVNDLQTLGGTRIALADVDALGDREQKEAIQQALLRVFKTTSAEVALPAFDNVDEDIDQLFLWIDENLPKEYARPEDLARAYDALAEADRFFGRIRRWQYYRYYVYIYNLLSAGIALAKSEKYPGAPTYVRSSRLLTVWMANQRNARKRSIAEKLAAATHGSARGVLNDVLLLRPIFQRGGKAAEAIAEELSLSDEETAWLRNK